MAINRKAAGELYAEKYLKIWQQAEEMKKRSGEEMKNEAAMKMARAKWRACRSQMAKLAAMRAGEAKIGEK